MQNPVQFLPPLRPHRLPHPSSKPITPRAPRRADRLTSAQSLGWLKALISQDLISCGLAENFSFWFCGLNVSQSKQGATASGRTFAYLELTFWHLWKSPEANRRRIRRALESDSGLCSLEAELWREEVIVLLRGSSTEGRDHILIQLFKRPECKNQQFSQFWQNCSSWNPKEQEAVIDWDLPLSTKQIIS